MKKTKDILSIKELADILGISRIAVFNKVKKGQIKAQKAGRNYIIYKKDVLDLISDEVSDKLKKRIDSSVDMVVSEYGQALKLLGEE
ncbi:MAG: helix-turn-helix domain-containing protein [Candidatus Komeilibacteria bacterium]|jgi:excisionase family DNA binding protein|nr:helix-turn-helix domain-containing protein [Candidatus Komeilibacteria bacterium]MBT4447860.1 helix-turn-helix domain-containing protein [Candidatus Komeilibacteria bacterium]